MVILKFWIDLKPVLNQVDHRVIRSVLKREYTMYAQNWE
jgi:hypothetical protein